MWSSRRFCQLCEPRFRRGRFAKPCFVAAALVAAGFVAGRLVRPAPPAPLVIERGGTTPNVAGRQTEGPLKLPPTPEPRYGPDGTAAERPTDPAEVVSICGARTKKGTPCQRRVRGTGRCWQHRGKSAMLPPAKLIVQ